MKTIGIDEDNFLVYEGNNHWGHGVWPTPVILPMSITDESRKDLSPAHSTGLSYFPYIFIDDGYDPTSRVRRGRVYEKHNQQPYQWHVYDHPALDRKTKIPDPREDVLPKSLYTFQQCYFVIPPLLTSVKSRGLSRV